MNADERRCGLCRFYKYTGERRKNVPHCAGKRGRPRRDPYDPICPKYERRQANSTD